MLQLPDCTTPANSRRWSSLYTLACAYQYNFHSEIKQRRILRKQSRSKQKYYAKKQKTTQRSKQTELKQQQQQQQQQQQFLEGSATDNFSPRRPFITSYMCLPQLANLKTEDLRELNRPCYAAAACFLELQYNSPLTYAATMHP